MTWIKDAIERRSVWPYRLSDDPVRLSIRGNLFKGKKQLGNPFEGCSWKVHRKKAIDALCRWNVFETYAEWDRMVIEMDFAMDHPEQFETMPILFAADVLCKSSRFRTGITGNFTDGKGEAILELKRQDLFGRVLLSPCLVLSRDVHQGSPFGATFSGTRLALGFAVQILLESPEERPGGGLQIFWHPFPAELENSLYHLVLDSGSAILHVNNRHPALKSIFEDRSKVGNRAKIRNALFALIAGEVWIQLANHAVEIQRQDLDDPEDASLLFSRRILKSLSKMLKKPSEEIQLALSDAASQASFSARLQHYFKTADHQNALITGLVTEEVISEVQP